MDKLAEAFEGWSGKGIFLLRLDYGYSAPSRASLGIDCASATASEIAGRISRVGLSGFVRLSNPHYAFSPRRRGADGEALPALLSERGALLETRFPKVFRNIAIFLGKKKIPFLSHDASHDGSLPPLYRQLRPDGELFRIHLRYEWETGLCMSRGSSVVVEAGRMISETEGPLTAGALAAGMGITPGAAASYLKWMEEAALVRKTGGGYMLRHFGLYSHFGVRPAGTRSVPPPKENDPMDLD